jgi:hypothetical protein
MEEVHDTGILTKNEVVVIYRCQHFKGVYCIGDMVYSDGLTIEPAMLTKDAGKSSRDFPHQYPSSPDHKLWMKLVNSLTQTGQKFC